MSVSKQDELSLITGAAGFAGGWLVDALLKRGEAVAGLSRRTSWKHAAPLVSCDLLSEELGRVLHELRPARVYHLAGYASPGASIRDPDGAWEGNLTATRRLTDALMKLSPRPRMLFVGSGLVYGQRPSIDEESPFRPETPYAASKAAADAHCFQASRELDLVIARPFNHTGPHQPPGYAIPDWARQLAAIGRGEKPAVLEVGDLSAHRDWSDVRDVAAAYILLMERGERGEAYNIACGSSVAMSEVLKRLVAASGLEVEVRTRADLVRREEPGSVRVDAGKLRRLGWSPAFDLDRTLADALSAWQEEGR